MSTAKPITPATSDLPEGWSLAKLEEISTAPQYGWTTSATRTPNGLKLVRTSDVSDGHIDWDSVPSCSDEPDDIAKFLLKRGDILVSRAGSVGVSYLITEAPRAVFASYLIRFCPLSPIDGRIIAFFMQSPDYWSAIAGETSGITIPNVNASKLKQLDVPIPPRNEQKRIVEKVEQLLARVNAARERLARVPVILKRFRQAVLAAACSGRLTADWRDLQPRLDPASELLHKIDQLRSGTAGKKRKPTSNGTSGFTDLDLPDTWIWATIQQVAEIRGGIQKQPKRAPKRNAYPYLRVANVLRDKLDLFEIHRMELFEGELETYRLEFGDLLIVEGNGSLNEIGRSALWTGAIENCVHQNHIIRVRVCLCSPDYLNIYWNSPVGRANVAEVAVTTSGLYSLSTAKIAAISVAIPSLEEQQEIVRRVDALFKLADAIETRVAAATVRADKLTQAILAKAFRGELVPTEAELARREGRSYEPASALLARIRSERESSTPTSSRLPRRVGIARLGSRR